MKRSAWLLGVTPLAAGVVVLGGAALGAGAGARSTDYIDVEISAVFVGREWGRIGAYPNGVAGHAISTTSHNVGTLPVDWHSPGSSNEPLDNLHPFIGQNLFRVRSGRLEQIGLAWMKHGFFSENIGCPDPGGDYLGVGCFDTYDIVSNQNRNYLGPRSEIDPLTAYWETCDSHFDTGAVGYTVPGDCMRSHGSSGHDAIQHRLRVADQDVLAADSPGQIIMEGFYIVADDIDLSTNWRHRFCTMTYSPSLVRWEFFDTGAEVQTPAIMGWGDEQALASPTDEGEVVVAVRVVDLGAGQRRYEYNVYNMNLDRAIDEFSIPLSPGVTVSNYGFHAPVENEEPLFSSAPWTHAAGADAIDWAPPAPNAGTGEQFPNTIRYGTMYTFWFDADTAPGNGAVSLSPYKPGAAPSLSAGVPVPCRFVEDLNGDGVVDTADLGLLLINFGGPGPVGDINGDLAVNTADLGIFLAAFGSTCLGG